MPRAPLSVFEYDATAPLDVREVGRTRRSGYVEIDLTYASPEGGRVPGYLYLPHGDGPFAGLLVLHGMPGSRENSRGIGERYAHMGAVVLAMTAPFGRPGRNRAHPIAFTEQDRVEQIQLIKDLRRGVDLLLAQSNVDPARIGFTGGSYGAAMGGLLAGVERRIQAYVLAVGDGGLVAHTTGPDDTRGPFTRLPPERQEAWTRAMLPIEPIRFVGDAAPAALFFQAGRRDRMVTPQDAAAFMAAASEPKETRWYDTGHGLNEAASRDQAMWLADRLGLDRDKYPPR